jgi:ADP-ribosylglycohydrolase
MTGAISGACYGIERIPVYWREKVENRDYLEQVAMKLREVKEKLQRVS